MITIPSFGLIYKPKELTMFFYVHPYLIGFSYCVKKWRFSNIYAKIAAFSQKLYVFEVKDSKLFIHSCSPDKVVKSAQQSISTMGIIVLVVPIDEPSFGVNFAFLP
jgi:hypothetical protein